MPPEWSSGFEVKLENSETPSTESQDQTRGKPADPQIYLEATYL